jgi:low affinity Fe/Cu permease
MDPHLFRVAAFLSKPPGFYLLIVAMVGSTALIPFGMTDIVTYGLSVAAILITGVVLIQGYRDTAAIHAKLDEIVLSMNEARNNVVGLEHSDAKEIKSTLKKIEQEALDTDTARGPANRTRGKGTNA